MTGRKHEDGAREATLRSSGRAAEIPPHRLLVVDDDSGFAEFVTAVVDGLDLDMAVRWAETGDQALRECDRFQPSLVLLDLRMPDEDGITLLRSLAHYDSKAEILLCSGVEGRILRSAVRIGNELGLSMAGAIAKPAGVTDLEAALRAHTARSPAVEEHELHRALEEDELVVHWQPKVSVASDTVTSAEALVRWKRPDGRQLSPLEFLPLFERAGLIERLTFRVFDLAIRQTQDWWASGLAIRAAVNLSAASVSDLSLPARCAEAVAAQGADPAQFILEITETAMMSDPLRSAEVLARLRLKGFGLSLDDFGTGYSSLARLQQLPFSELKIDRSFVVDLGRTDDAEILVRSMTDLAHNLGLEACAEGIETVENWEAIRELGCDTAQGYYISHPLVEADFAGWVETRATRTQPEGPER